MSAQQGSPAYPHFYICVQLKRVQTGSFDDVLLLLSFPGAHEEYDGKTQPSNSEY